VQVFMWTSRTSVASCGLDKDVPMTELRWRKEPPDSPGMWLRKMDVFYNVLIVRDRAPEICHFAEEEWCKLPEILPAKRKAVWRLWVVQWRTPADSGLARVWAKEGCDISSQYRVCIKTEVTEERDEPDACTCPVIDGVPVTGSGCPLHGLPRYEL
jgi:hypothetical protein